MVYECVNLPRELSIGDDLRAKLWMAQGAIAGCVGEAVACHLSCPYRVMVLYPETSLGIPDSFPPNLYAHILSCFTSF